MTSETGSKPAESKPKETVRVSCQNCLRETNHDVLAEFANKNYLEEPDITFFNVYQVVRCRGCERVSFRYANWSDNEQDEYGDPVVLVDLYPYRLAGTKMMDGLRNLPDDVRRVYEETHKALAADATVLGTIGIRAVVEAVCNEKKAAGKNLEDKIESLIEGGWLSPTQAQFLNKSRVLGNLAAHEIKPPSASTLQIALNIIENLLQTVYILPKAAESMEKK